MTAFDYDLIVDRDPTCDADLDKLFEAFDPAGFTITPGISSGTPLISCIAGSDDLMAESSPPLESIMRQAISLAEACGFTVVRVEVAPEALAEAA